MKKEKPNKHSSLLKEFYWKIYNTFYSFLVFRNSIHDISKYSLFRVKGSMILLCSLFLFAGISGLRGNDTHSTVDSLSYNFQHNSLNANSQQNIICSRYLNKVAISLDCPLVEASYNGPLCVRDMLVLTGSGSGISSWAWTGPNGFISNAQNPQIDPVNLSNAGVYTLVATDFSASTCSSTVDVIINPLPTVTSGSYGPLCFESPAIPLFGSPLGGVWTGSGSGIVGNTFDPTISGPGLHNVTYSFTDGNNCTNSMQTAIEVYDEIGILISPDNLCLNSSGLIDATISNGNAPLTFVWTDLGTGTAMDYALLNTNYEDPIINAQDAQPGTIDLELSVTDFFGCTNSEVVQILINPLPTISAQPVAAQFCVDSDAMYSVEVLEPNVSYQWQVNSGSGVFNNIPGATDSELVLPAITMGMNDNLYRVMVTLDNTPDPDCFVLSDVAVLKVNSGGALVCDDLVNISVLTDCSSDIINAGYFLEGQEFFENYLVMITDSEGNPVEYTNGENLSMYIGQFLTYTITDVCSGNYCWGNVVFEDYTEPEIMCNCPVGGEDLDGDGSVDGYAEECTLSCYEFPLFKEKYWESLTDLLIPSDVEDFIEDNITDNCDTYTEDHVSYYDRYEDLGCGGALLRRTWILTYPAFGGEEKSISCTQEYYFAPIGLETLDTARIDPITNLPKIAEDSIILPFEVVVLDCGADISPAGIAAFYDNPISEDQDTDDDRIDPDEFDIDCVIENNEGIAYAYPHYYMYGRNPSGPHAQPISTEVCNLIVAYTDTEVEVCAPGCGSNRKILRTWTILDWCKGEFIQYDQAIKAVDLDAPEIEVYDITASVDPWKCSADVLLPHPEHLRDACDDNLSYWIGYVEGGLTISGNATDGYIMHDALLGENISVEYVTEDCCGNRGTTVIEVDVIDLTPPVAITKEFIVISLANIGNPDEEDQGIAKLYAIDVDNLSYDGCTGVTVEIRRTELHCEGLETDTIFSDNVKFCCEDLNGLPFVEIDVEFRVTDEFGNANYAWATVRLEDKSIPIHVCPVDIAMTCDMDFNDLSFTGLPTAFSACGDVNLMCDAMTIIDDTSPRRKGPNDGFFDDPKYDGQTIPAFDPLCGYGALRRQFGSCASCVQWIVVEPIDPFDPSTIVWPEDQVVDCDNFETGEPRWEESICNLIGYSITTDTFRFQDGACLKILNHWSIINWCEYDAANPTGGGRYEHTQVIKLIDTQDPVLTVEDSLVLGVIQDDCISKGLKLEGSATDEGECGSEWIKWEVTIDLKSDWVSDYYFSTDLPVLVNGEPNPYHLEPTGNGELVTIYLPDGMPVSKIWHRAVWRASDGCGNSTNVIRYFRVSDTKAPTPYCLNLSTAVMSGSGEVELWAIDFNVGSFDNCSEDDVLIYTFTDIPPPPRDDSEYTSNSDLMWYDGSFWYFDSETGSYKDQDDYMDRKAHQWNPILRSTGKIFSIEDVDTSGILQIPIYVWDECGNKDFCIVNLRVIDNMGVGEGRISGQMVTEYGDEIEGVTVELNSSNPEYPIADITNESGEFAFYNVPFYVDYEVYGSKNDDYLNGISTLDLLLIQKHILGNQILNSPYKMIAADVNNDKDISAIDLIELRKLILGIYNELPQNGSWKAIDAKQDLSVNNPWVYKDYISIQDLNADRTSEDFIGVKIGDVNESATANLGKGSDVERKSILAINYDDKFVTPGEIIEVELTADVQENIYGYQFTMDYDNMEFLDIKGDNISMSNVAIHEGSLTMSYNDVNAVDNDKLFTMTFKAINESFLSNNLKVSSSITKAEAYVGKNLDILDINLLGGEDNLIEFTLYQNQPNPFSNYTVIGFELPEKDNIKLSLFDVTGKLIKVIETSAQKGYNELKVSKSDIEIKGLIHYKMETSLNTATKHMLLIE